MSPSYGRSSASAAAGWRSTAACSSPGASLSAIPSRCSDPPDRSPPASFIISAACLLPGNIEHAEAGGLVAYSANLFDLERRSASFVDKFSKGAKPADLPVEQTTKFELVINMKTAKALGLTIPQSLRLRADQVIQ